MAKKIMILGTMSNVGKSLIAAGLCRIFKEDGYRVAPFKSQNMALNSFITADGLEIGRAQAMQAEAAGIAPTVDMNPILLKPTTDTGSQVILRGEVMAQMTAKEYYAYKRELIPQVLASFKALEESYDIIVIEGAGSPAEINLKKEDIVNMGMARMVGAPCLLVGDIDRGGVFAQLLGTLMLLTGEERPYIKGQVINKFRGDLDILTSGLMMLEEKTDLPVVGVAPYLDIDVEDEDSLSERFSKKKIGLIDIAVIRLPKISNFTDFNPLEAIDDVTLRYVERPSDLKSPDMIILPGTKNTLKDLQWLRESGFESLILRKAGEGVPVLGICGGYQMLGELIRDEHGVEGGGSIRGLGLLPMITDFREEKTRTQVSGYLGSLEGVFSPLGNAPVRGYEIHMGAATFKEAVLPLLYIGEERKPEGAYINNVMGTYLHGFFDTKEISSGIIHILMERKGLSNSVVAMDYQDYKELQYDKLAKALRESLNMGRIYEIMERGI